MRQRGSTRVTRSGSSRVTGTGSVLVAVVLLSTLALGACRPATLGARCRTTELGDDGGDWLLRCRSGRWARAITKRDVAVAIAEMLPPADDDYPRAWRDAPIDSIFDTWGYPNRECTSFVAWRVEGVGGVRLPVHPGDASAWAQQLAPYFRVDATPAVGAIAQWNAGESAGGLGAGPLGHVAWVREVRGDGSVVVEQYNLSDSGAYSQLRTRAPRYIHVDD